MREFDEIRRRLDEENRHRPHVICCSGATGPTGPTDTYDYFFNKINRNYSSLFLINT